MRLDQLATSPVCMMLVVLSLVRQTENTAAVVVAGDGILCKQIRYSIRFVLNSDE